ncbi:hypothetical protein HDU82_002467 [Entophlyctis luteolus]|nr:hypothetical protein HDU82_002467 [Entophlyctis luteolus]
MELAEGKDLAMKKQKIFVLNVTGPAQSRNSPTRTPPHGKTAANNINDIEATVPFSPDTTFVSNEDAAEAIVPNVTEFANKQKFYDPLIPRQKLDAEGPSYSALPTDRLANTPGSSSQKSRFQSRDFQLTAEDENLVEILVNMRIYGGEVSELKNFIIQKRIRLSHYKEGRTYNRLTATPRKYWVLVPNQKENGFDGYPNIMIWEKYLRSLPPAVAQTCKVYDLERREFVPDETVSAVLRG